MKKFTLSMGDSLACEIRAETRSGAARKALKILGWRLIENRPATYTFFFWCGSEERRELARLAVETHKGYVPKAGEKYWHKQAGVEAWCLTARKEGGNPIPLDWAIPKSAVPKGMVTKRKD